MTAGGVEGPDVIAKAQALGVKARTLVEGLRLEEIVATFGESSMTFNLEEFASILNAPPAELLNEFDALPFPQDSRPPGPSHVRASTARRR